MASHLYYKPSVIIHEKKITPQPVNGIQILMNFFHLLKQNCACIVTTRDPKIHSPDTLVLKLKLSQKIFSS